MIRWGILQAMSLLLCVGCGSVATGDAGPGDGDAAAIDASGDLDAATSCGNGSLDDGEDCDEGEDNGTATSCCAGNCSFVAASITCRAATSACDVADECTGSSATCPADEHVADTSSCTAGMANTCCGGACVIGNGACGACALPDPGAMTITIIESTSMGEWAVMDSTWKTQAEALGHTATIVPQTTLDAIANLTATDVLIVPAGAIDIPANRIATIQAFVVSGRGVYLSGEYQASYTSNQGFASIVTALGGSFTWGADVSGEQDPVEVIGCNGTLPATVPQITDFFYAATGTGTGVEVIARKVAGGIPFGWSFCRPGGGMIMNVTDADFVWRLTPVEFMTNVITRLGNAATCAD